MNKVSKCRIKRKRTLVDMFGGKCAICGYNKYIGALDFHHLDPKTKEFGLSRNGITRSLEKCIEEAKKCILLCSNCHREVEAKITICPVLEARNVC